MSAARAKALAAIERNIAQSGFHIYIVSGGATPRFAYTIGLRRSLGAELVFPGALYYDDKDDVLEIVHAVRKQLAKGKLGSMWDSKVTVRGLGSFTFRRAHSSWTRELLLGALDYYQIDDVDAYQIVPEARYRTIDVPDLSAAWSAASEPVWRWLHDPWDFSVPESAEAMTSLEVLRGACVTEACRFEEDYWEVFAGDGAEVPKAEARLVPLATIIAADPSLARVVDLKVGAGVYRDDAKSDWQHWTRGRTSE
ncbi:MAG TPA: DUF4262 domain-containing protein [Kofleriaceae bacterium]|nr:DUF4262 domain-containing protein [Kofleriaceae bacterium]